MRMARHNAAIRWLWGLSLMLATLSMPAQQKSVPPAVPLTEAPGQHQGTEIDGVVAVVNGDVILESDVEEERRFETIQPYRGRVAEFSRDRAVQRLIDRTLILQQALVEADQISVSKEELDKQIITLRKDIPACREFHCETDAG